MKVLKNPVVAVILTAIIIVSSSLLSAGIKLEGQCRSVTDGFYHGVKYKGYKHPAIYTQLKNICGAVSGMVTVADNYGIDTAEISALEGELDASISQMHNNISDVYKRYSALDDAILRLERQLENTSMTARDKEGYELYRSEIAGAKKTVEEAGYNESVRSFVGDLGFLPNVFIKLTDTALPELFA